VYTPKKSDIVESSDGPTWKGKLKIVEVTFGWDPSWAKTVELTERKYEPLVKALKRAGWRDYRKSWVRGRLLDGRA
jgi:hypothetical protein